MKYFLTFITFYCLSNISYAQTGGLTTNIDFVRDVQCATYNLKLDNADTTIYFTTIRPGDSLDSIPVGLYYATFYSCDTSFNYGQKIEIIENEVRSIYFRNNGYIGTDYYGPSMYTDSYYYDYYDSLYKPVYFGVSWQFSRGIDYDNVNPNLLNNFALDYILGMIGW